MGNLENKGDHGYKFFTSVKPLSLSLSTDNQKRGNRRNLRDVFSEPDSINDTESFNSGYTTDSKVPKNTKYSKLKSDE